MTDQKTNKLLKNKNEKSRDNILSLVTFSVSDQLFALPTTAVRDVFDSNNITPVQLAPKAIAGLLNIRGYIYSVISLREYLDLPPLRTRDDRIFYSIDREGDKYCLMVDNVGEVITAEEKRFKQLPCTLEQIYGAVASRIYKLEKDILILLDMGKIFTHKKLLSEENS